MLTRAERATTPAATRRPAPARPPGALSPAARRRVASGPPALRLGVPEPVNRVIASPGPGEPLSAGLRAGLERAFGADLGGVRVHADPRSAAAAAAIPARAFAFGEHIFLGGGQRPNDPELIAHEVAHVLQQADEPAILPFTRNPGGDRFEAEAVSAGRTAARGGTVEVRERTGGPIVQGLSLSDLVGEFETWIWEKIQQYAPELYPILKQGVLEWLKGRLGDALDAVFETLSAPFRAVGDIASSVGKHFAALLTWMRDAAARIARGDCSALSEAAEKIEQVVTGLAAPVIDKVKELAKKAGDFFKGLWERFGAPAWEFLKKVGGVIWEKIQQVGRWLWEKTKPIRDIAEWVWGKFKNWLGIGEGEEGQNGVLQWFQRKAEAAWDWVKAKLDRFKKPLMVIGGVLVMLSPAGPLIAIGAVVAGLIQGVRWIKANIRSQDGVVTARDVLRKVILPQMLGAVNGVTAAITNAAKSLTGTLGKVVGGLGELSGALAGSILKAAVGIIDWALGLFERLLTWAADGVGAVADAIGAGLDKLVQFAQPVIEVLERVTEVLGDLLKIPLKLLGAVWNKIPACVRNPFINFLVNRVLKQVPIFSDFVAVAEKWAEVKDEVIGIVRQVFKDKDFAGAMRRTFSVLLRVLNVPVDLAKEVFAKAASAWDAVFKSPTNFLRNILKAIKQGFGLFFDNFLTHFASGVVAWLTGQLSGTGIQLPSSLTDFRGMLRMVLQILGITTDHVFELLGKRLPKPQVDALRKAFNLLTGAWEWIADLVKAGAEGPAALWAKIKEDLAKLGDMLLDALGKLLADLLIQPVIVRLVSMLDPSGIMAVVNSILAVYAAIQTAVEYLERILRIVNSVLDMVLDIAGGVVGGAARLLEGALARALPVALGFVANFLKVGKVTKKLSAALDNVRKKVDDAILKLIDKALAAGRAILKAVGLGQKPGQPAAGEQNIDVPAQVGAEGHTLRAVVGDGPIRLLMSSNGFAEFPGRMDELRTRYTAIFAASPASAALTAKLTQEVDQLKGQWDTINRQAAAIVIPPGDPLSSQAAQARRSREAVIRSGLAVLAQRLAALGQHFTFGPGKAVAVGDSVVRKAVGHGAIVAEVGVVIQGPGGAYDFGIRARTGTATVLIPLLYKDHGISWEVPASGPPPSGPGTYAPGPPRMIVAGLPFNTAATNPSGVPPALLAPPHTDQGHLVANRFYGPNSYTSGNIVPMTVTANRSGMKVIENAVAARIAATGAVFRYEVTPLPPGQMPPDQVVVVAHQLFPLPPPPALTFPPVQNV